MPRTTSPETLVKIEAIRQYAGRMSSTDIGKALGLNRRYVQSLAAKNQISLGLNQRQIIGVCCPECGRRGKVLETIRKADGTTRRRYEDTQGHRWTTMERIEGPTAESP